MWEARDRQSAREIFAAWYRWAVCSRLEPVKRVARMLERQLQGVLNSIASGAAQAWRAHPLGLKRLDSAGHVQPTEHHISIQVVRGLQLGLVA